MEGDFGASWAVGRSVPLAAVFFLSQAAADETTRCCWASAAVGLYRAAMEALRAVDSIDSPSRHAPFRRAVFSNAASAAASLPCFEFRLSPTGRFWEKIEAVLGAA